MKKTVYTAWYGKTHNAFDEVYETILGDPKSKTGKFPVYGVANKDKIRAEQTFDTEAEARRWVISQLRPLTTKDKNGKAIRGIVYAAAANRRAFIVGQAQMYVINDKKATGTQVYAAGGWRAKKI